MKTYKVIIMPTAETELNDIYRYIAYELMAPDAAANKFNDILGAAYSLSAFPKRCRIMENHKHLGLRKLIVGEYSIIYFIKGTTVMVTRILYSHSDIDAALEEI